MMHRLLYGKFGRRWDIPLGLFYLLAPIYAAHWFFARLSEGYGVRRAAEDTVFNFRFARNATLLARRDIKRVR